MSRLLALLLVVLLVASACSSPAGPTLSPPDTAPATPATAASTPPDSVPFADETVPGADGTPRDGGVLIIGVSGLTSLDPVDADPTSVPTMVALDLLFDGLTAIDADSGEATASLATSWSVSDDQLTWTFELGEHTFANGRLVTASDVKWSIERIAGLGLESVAGYQLRAIEGYDAVAAGETAELSGIAAFGSASVQVRLVEPFSPLAELLASPMFGIVPRDAIQVPGSTFASEPVGSGPLTFDGRADNTVLLRRTDRFVGRLDGVDLRVFATADDAYDAFSAGEVDWAAVPSDRVGTTDASIGYEARTPYGANAFFGMNAAAEDLATPALRLAIVRAVDRAALVADLFDGVASPMTGLVPPAVAGSSSDACGDRCRHNPSLAEQLVTTAFPDGDVPTVDIDYLDGDPREAAMAEAVAEQLEAVGIPTALHPGSVEEIGERVEAGEHELFRFGWLGGYESPDAWLGPLFASASPDNLVGLADDEVDALLSTARSTTGTLDRAAAYRDLEAEVLSAMVVLPLFTIDRVVAVSDRVQDYAQRGDGTLDLAAVWLS